MNNKLILNEIKKHYGFKTDVEFANFLGINANTLSNWKSRNTFDYGILYTKCVDIDPKWIATGGKGNMILSNYITPDSISTVSESRSEYGTNTDKDLQISQLKSQIKILQETLIMSASSRL